jgi:hypothetical protein
MAMQLGKWSLRGGTERGDLGVNGAGYQDEKAAGKWARRRKVLSPGKIGEKH